MKMKSLRDEELGRHLPQLGPGPPFASAGGAGLPWSYDLLTPPTFGPTLAKVDCRVKPPIGEATGAYHQHLLCSLSSVCTTLPTLHYWTVGMRGGPDIKLRDLGRCALIGTPGLPAMRFRASSTWMFRYLAAG